MFWLARFRDLAHVELCNNLAQRECTHNLFMWGLTAQNRISFSCIQLDSTCTHVRNNCGPWFEELLTLCCEECYFKLYHVGNSEEKMHSASCKTSGNEHNALQNWPTPRSSGCFYFILYPVLLTIQHNTIQYNFIAKWQMHKECVMAPSTLKRTLTPVT